MNEKQQIAKLVNAACIDMPKGNLPVIVKISSGIRCLGTVRTHNDASFMGICCGISCEKVSRAKVEGSDQIFFWLH